MVRVAEALLVKEVLDGEEITALVEGKTLEDLVVPVAATPAPSAAPADEGGETAAEATEDPDREAEH
jgi:hypothetical protein